MFKGLREDTDFEEIIESMKKFKEHQIIFFKFEMCIRHSINQHSPEEGHLWGISSDG